MQKMIPVLALYDFRSKQEYIYRTNKMKEITGASELIAGMYDEFLKIEPRIVSGWEDGLSLRMTFDDETIGEVVYVGGGNLCVLYRSREDYIASNKRFSRYVLENAYGLTLLAACANWTGDYQASRAAAYRELDRKKRVGCTGAPDNVLPFTQVDRNTFQAITSKDPKAQEELSRESSCKRIKFEARVKEDPAWAKQGRFIDDIAANRGEDSLIAVIYSDGNSIGEKLKSVQTVEDMRAFSKEVHGVLIERTEEAVRQRLESLPEEFRDFRVIVDHGDEITLICNAHAVPFALDAYFQVLSGTGYSACAGVAFCHSHDPFSSVYEIAEECCESGKNASRNNGGGSYIDFHYCRSGITGSLEQIREKQDGEVMARPYRVDGNLGYQLFLRVGEILHASKVTRSDIKSINRAINQGESWYLLEYERLKAKDTAAFENLELLASSETLKKILFDVSSF